MSNICAGIGRGQMMVLAARVAQRRANYEYYKQGLNGFKGIYFLDEPEGFFSNRWLSCIFIDQTKNVRYASRESVRVALEKENIEARPLWKPMHMQPVFAKYPFFENGTSERLFNNGLCLPSGTNLHKEDLDRVISTIKLVLG
jgi:dTDP-4-amino-4,6-dideoxygalactose transaminase